MKLFSSRAFTHVLPHMIFWTWNGLFASVVYFGLLPIIFVDMVRDIASGQMPSGYALSMALVLLTPLTAIVLGVVFRREPRKLLALFYAVEAPLFLLAMIRLFLLHEMPPLASAVLVAFGVGATSHLASLFVDPAHQRAWVRDLFLVAHSVGLVLGIYSACLLLFFTVPAAAACLEAFFGLHWLVELSRMGAHVFSLGFLFFLLFACSASLFVVMPYAMATLYVRRFLRTFAEYDRRGMRWYALALTSSVVVACVTGYALLDRQPQHLAFERLENAPQTDAERLTLLSHADAIRDGLLNAYLWRFRYPDVAGETRVVTHLFERQVHLPVAAAEAVGRVYELFAKPLLYQRVTEDRDDTAAADRYAAFFDTPIQKGAKSEVLTAVESTYARDTREAGLIDEGGQKVHLVRQDLSVREVDGCAELELHEVYENRTFEDLEILYYFSLPETAVMTGLWLGENDRRDQAFAFTVSTRGAAQAVYRAEVRRRVDPALLEQIGPRQYRLRVYPIPARSSRGDVTETPVMHLWLTYVALPEAEGWPLPRLSEARSVYFDEDTVRTVNGEPAAAHRGWMQAALPIAHPPLRRLRTVRFEGGLAIRATPLAGTPELISSGRRFALVLDRSYSMSRHADEVERSLVWLRDEIAPRASFDLFLTSASSRGEPPSVRQDASLGASGLIYFGGQSMPELLEQASGLMAEIDREYDAVLVLTDEGSLDLARDGKPTWDVSVPLWMVHLGGTLPAGYDDATTETIQRSGGGVATDVREVFAAFARAERFPGAWLSAGGGYRFSLVTGDDGEPGEDDADPLFARIAARQLINAAITSLDVTDRAVLDRLHGVAKRHGVVTPYSSMIVLVNDRQKEALRKAEAADDRFEREVEPESEALGPPGSEFFGGDLTGTPEPEEWALILLVLGGLVWADRRRIFPGLRPG